MSGCNNNTSIIDNHQSLSREKGNVRYYNTMSFCAMIHYNHIKLGLNESYFLIIISII